MQKLQKILIPLYILFLIGSFFYIRSVLKGVPATAVSEEDKVVQATPVKVTLEVKSPSVNKSYTTELKSTASISDLLLKVKEDHADFTFDRISYSYGSVLEHVNNIKNTETKKWKIYSSSKDITLVSDSTYLEDGATYTLIYE